MTVVRLTREVRFAVNTSADSKAGWDGSPNRWSSWPRMVGIRPYIKIRSTVSGPVDPETGYLCNIKRIDEIVQNELIDHIVLQVEQGTSASQLSHIAFETVQKKLADGIQVEILELVVSPHLKYAKKRNNDSMISVTQQFEFSATHRLHCEQLSDEENRALFGKCNNPHGHGHNYVVEVTVNVQGFQSDTHVVSELESVVKKEVVDPFDHKNLNVEVEQFAKLNPTVENIAGVIWQLLMNKLSQSTLANVRVYETPKTWADYSATV